MSLTRSTLSVMTSRVFLLSAGLIVALMAAHSRSPVERDYFFTFIILAAAQTLLAVKYLCLSGRQKCDDVSSL